MAIELAQTVIESDWNGLYGEKWADLICPDAVAHPAKFSRKLIAKIYQHAIDEGWLVAGSSVIDPFGGVALGAFDAMRHGLHWTGVELEMRFVGLGTVNILQWDNRFKGRLPLWGSARLLQGDSRNLASVIDSANCVVSSPPYANDTVNDRNGIDLTLIKSRYGKNSQAVKMSGYSSDVSNLGNLHASDADHAAIISSPPYSPEALGHKGKGSAIDAAKGLHARCNDNSYGDSDGQLSQLREGDFSAIITSPPFVESLASDDPDKRGGLFTKDPKRRNDKTLTATYGTADGQLGAMKAGAIISSPPYEGCPIALKDGAAQRQMESLKRAIDEGRVSGRESLRVAKKGFNKNTNLNGAGGNYNQSNEDNLGNSTGDTFWAASKTILEQCHAVLAPNSKAIFVCKDFVRKGKRVEFCKQWAMLCEAVGFRLIHWHRSWLVEKHGEQHAMDGAIDSIETHRKSFFRILAERKGSPRIDYEIVMCLERI